jgi:hypothetical protein
MLALEELAVAGETSALMKRLFFEVGQDITGVMLYYCSVLAVMLQLQSYQKAGLFSRLTCVQILFKSRRQASASKEARYAQEAEAEPQ